MANSQNILNNVLISDKDAVSIHLDALDNLLSRSTPRVPEAVLASISLRFLADGSLNRVAHAENLNLIVQAPDLTGIPYDSALLFACGGYSLGQMSVCPHYTYRQPGLHSPFRPQFEAELAASPKEHRLKEYKLKEFWRLPCLALCGRILDRETIARYVANKCGGAHHSVETKGFDDIDLLLTQLGHVLRLNGDDISVTFLETLGTASFLLKSPTVITLRERLRSPDAKALINLPRHT